MLKKILGLIFVITAASAVQATSYLYASGDTIPDSSLEPSTMVLVTRQLVGLSEVRRTGYTIDHQHWTWAYGTTFKTGDVITNTPACYLFYPTNSPSSAGRTTEVQPALANGGYLIATCIPNIYPVALDDQDATSHGTANVTVTYDAAMPPVTCPEKTGYTFGGYWTGPDGSGTQYYNADGTGTQTWDRDASNVILRASWTAVSNTVTLDACGATISGTPSVEAVYGRAMPSISCPQKTGYTFDGYWSERDGGGAQYYTAAGGSATNWTQTVSITLYAQWHAMTGSVTLSANGATTPGTVSVRPVYDQPMPPAVMPERIGYTFGGYWTDANGNGTQYYAADGSSARIWDRTGYLTLYAQWTPNSYTVTLKTKSGTINAGNVTSYTHGSVTQLPMDVTRIGYVFGGWYTTEGCFGTPVSAITANDIGDLTFYAKWTRKTYAVAFYRNRTGADREYRLQDGFEAGAEKELTANTFTNPGYSFAHWTTARDGTGDVYTDGQTVVNLTDEDNVTVDLYAQWLPNRYTVTFDPNGGTGTMPEMSFTYGTAQALPLNTFTRSGYTFAGWVINGLGTGTVFADGQSVSNLTEVADGTVSLKASWDAGKYTVHYLAGGGTGTMPDETVKVDVAHMLAANAFIRDGYAFAGWATNGTDILFADRAVVTNLVPADAETFLTATWTGVTYRVVLSGDGTGTAVFDGNVSVVTNFVTVGDPYTMLPQPSNTESRWHFDGWTYVDGVTNAAVPAAVLPPSAGATNLFTRWRWEPDALAVALDVPESAVETAGTTTWRVDPETALYGPSSVQCVGTSDGGTCSTWMSVKLTGRGRLTFYWRIRAPARVSEEMPPYINRGTRLRFCNSDIDSPQTLLEDLEGGRPDEWILATYKKTNETSEVVRWWYEFDGASVGQTPGTGWVDHVVWTPSGSVTETHQVPYSWLRENFPAWEDTTDAGWETLAEMNSPGSDLAAGGKQWPNGSPVFVWQDYVAGTIPTDSSDLFRAYITITNGTPSVLWSPNLYDAEPPRVYTVRGAPAATIPPEAWAAFDPTDGGALATNRFFKVEVRLQ